MIYLVNPTHPPAIAVTETEERAARYRAKGYEDVSPAAFSAAWAERDRCVRLAQEIMPPGWVEAQDEPAPDTRHRIVGALAGKVYPRTETGL